MKKLAVALSVAIFFPSLVFAQVPNQPASTSDLQKQIQNLLKQIQVLQQQVSVLQAELGKEPEQAISSVPSVPAGASAGAEAGETPQTSPTTEDSVSKPESTPPELTRSLSRGSSGDDVRKLQEFLSKDKDIYPAGLITGFFGPATESAVKRWQKKHNIESAGVMGPKSIAKLKDLGRGRVQQLIEEGAGASGIIPPGLLHAPGIRKRIEESTSVASTPASSTGAMMPTISTTTMPSSATPTPYGTIPATPATPAVPSSGTGTVVSAVPATPATPAGSTTQDATPPSVTLTGPYPGLSSTCTVLYNSSYSDNVAVFGVQKKVDGANLGTEYFPNSGSGFVGTDNGCLYLANGSHTFTMIVRDAAGNATTKSIAISIPLGSIATTTTAATTAATTTIPLDTVTPIISGAQATNITAMSATIVWTTNESSDSQIEYGVTANYGSTTVLDSSLTTSHSVALSHLQSSAVYYYRVKSKDAAGNLGMSADSLTTLTPPKQCADGTDNDSDGLIDLNDRGCADASDDDETDPPPVSAGPEVRVTAASANRLWPRISGSSIVWQEGDYGDIFWYDISSRAQKQITATANKCCPSVSGNRIVYRFYENSSSSGIKMYDLSTNAEKIIAQGASSRSFGKPAIDGDNVVYEADEGVYFYNLATSAEKKLASSSYLPSVSGDDIVWEHKADYVIWHYKISTGVTRSISPTDRVYPHVSNGVVVYQAYRGIPWDVFTYDLVTNTETKRTTRGVGGELGFSMSGNTFVWQEGYGTSAVNYLYDVGTGKKTVIANVSSYKSAPWISGNRAAWMDSRYSGAQTYDVLYVDVSNLSSAASRRQNLATISQALNAMREKLIRLLQGL